VRDGKGRVDRTVYLADAAVQALQEYLALRGEGSSDHVLLYRHAAVKKDLIRARLAAAGARVGVKVYPHRLRHTCATQLLNAGCPVTSIQRFLGHKRLNTTMIYARAHDQTVADDYFAAMARIEQRLEGASAPEEVNDQATRVQSSQESLRLIEELALPGLSVQARIGIAAQLRKLLGLWQMGEAVSFPFADLRAPGALRASSLPAHLPSGQTHLVFTRAQLDRLGIGANVTHVPCGSKRFRLPTSAAERDNRQQTSTGHWRNARCSSDSG